MSAVFPKVKWHLDFFFPRISELIQFFKRFNYSENFSNLKDKHWILKLEFLVDINFTDHLNVLNYRYKGKIFCFLMQFLIFRRLNPN